MPISVGQDMAKGAMTLIDEDRAEALYAARREPSIVSGGSAANTIVGVASFGVKCAYIGKVKNDPLGETFAHDIRAMGVGFSTAPAEHGPATGRCFVYVTPDGERTMNTFLGASTYLSPDDVDEDLVRAARFVYLEGYMWDRPAAKEAFRKAGRIARAAGNRVSLTLSDSFCVDRFRGEFIDLMRSGVVDTVFANTDELLSLYETPHLNEGLDALGKEGVTGVVTRSEKGSVIVEGGRTLGGPGVPDPEGRRHDRRGRYLRGGVSRGAGAPRRPDDLRAARRARRRRDHPASRRAARGVARRARARTRHRLLAARPPSFFQAFSKYLQTFRLESPNFSKHFFVGFERFQGVKRAPRPIFYFQAFSPPLGPKPPPIAPGGGSVYE